MREIRRGLSRAACLQRWVYESMVRSEIRSFVSSEFRPVYAFSYSCFVGRLSNWVGEDIVPSRGRHKGQNSRGQTPLSLAISMHAPQEVTEMVADAESDLHIDDIYHYYLWICTIGSGGYIGMTCVIVVLYSPKWNVSSQLDLAIIRRWHNPCYVPYENKIIALRLPSMFWANTSISSTHVLICVGTLTISSVSRIFDGSEVWIALRITRGIRWLARRSIRLSLIMLAGC